MFYIFYNLLKKRSTSCETGFGFEILDIVMNRVEQLACFSEARCFYSGTKKKKEKQDGKFILLEKRSFIEVQPFAGQRTYFSYTGNSSF